MLENTLSSKPGFRKRIIYVDMDRCSRRKKCPKGVWGMLKLFQLSIAEFCLRTFDICLLSAFWVPEPILSRSCLISGCLLRIITQTVFVHEQYLPLEIYRKYFLGEATVIELCVRNEVVIFRFLEAVFFWSKLDVIQGLPLCLLLECLQLECSPYQCSHFSSINIFSAL